jgi:hypothetical protein
VVVHEVLELLAAEVPSLPVGLWVVVRGFVVEDERARGRAGGARWSGLERSGARWSGLERSGAERRVGATEQTRMCEASERMRLGKVRAYMHAEGCRREGCGRVQPKHRVDGGNRGGLRKQRTLRGRRKSRPSGCSSPRRSARSLR